MLLWVDHNTTRFSSVLQNNYSSWVQNKQHGGTVEASSSRPPHTLVNKQLHHIRGGDWHKLRLDQTNFLIYGGKLKHLLLEKVFTVHSFNRVRATSVNIFEICMKSEFREKSQDLRLKSEFRLSSDFSFTLSQIYKRLHLALILFCNYLHFIGQWDQ